MDRYFEGENFTHEDLVMPSDGEFVNCRFTGIDFSGASFKNTKILDSKFEKCNFSNASLINASIMGAQFNYCKLMGLNWTQGNNFRDIKFNQSLLDLSVLQERDLSSFEFLESSLKDVDFSGANLKTASFKGSNLLNALFNQCNLEKADFTSCQNYWVDPVFNKIKGAKFNMPDALVLFKALGVEIEH